MNDDHPPDSGASMDAQPPADGAVSVSDEQHVPVDADRLRTSAARALRALGVPARAALDVTLVSPARIAELEQHAFGERAPTDVLSFPLDDPRRPMPGPMLLGDVVLCPAVAERQARALGRTLDDELERLLVHGLLHLLGSDHADRVSEHAMALRERSLLARVSEGAR